MRKTLVYLSILGVFSWLAASLFGSAPEALEDIGAGDAYRGIGIIESGTVWNISNTRARTVGELLSEQNIHLGDSDLVWPAQAARIYPGCQIVIEKRKNIIVTDGGAEREILTSGATVGEALWESGIEVRPEDILEPGLDRLISDGDRIGITRVIIKEESEFKKIAFKTLTEEDNKLGWREKKTKQKGENGQEELIYQVVYHDSKEISRKIIERKTISDPKPEIIVQGTYVKTGKSHEGRASWYAFTGTMSAANPWLPIGSFVRVTNRANGKSVIVRINDRGPFVPGRIIDLDKVAFQKIASIGAGVVDIKMEEIVN